MIKVLKGQAATLVILSLALLAQLPHAAEVFMLAGDTHGWWGAVHGFAYAVALELAVLLFVVQGRKRESYGFALVSVLVNLAYYAERASLLSTSSLRAWLISLALPIAIALYSHALADEDASACAQVDVHAWWLQVRKMVGLQVHEAQEETSVRFAELAVEYKQELADNLHAEDVKLLAQNLRNAGRKIADIAQVVGKSESWVSRNTEAVMG